MNNTEENISNFEDSCSFFERELTHAQLYEFLNSGTIAEKQLACIKIESVTDETEAAILMQNLTGIDGKVREAVSFKLQSFIRTNPDLFKKREFYNIFLTSVIDINGNICRNIITSLTALTTDKDFCEYFTNALIASSNQVIDTINQFNCKDRKYVTNKEVFKLYWYLETLSIFDDIPQEALHELITRVSKIDEYTVREKAANLIPKLKTIAKELPENLNFDNNFYVNLALLRK